MPLGVLVTTVASVTKDALDIGLVCQELPRWRHTLCSMVIIGERRSFSSTGKGVTGPRCSHLPGVRICSDIVPLFPRDLKRDVAKKLEKLEKRTQRAIAELIRGLWCLRERHLGSPDIPEGLCGPYWELGALLSGQGGTGGV